MKEKWAYLALMSICLISCYQESSIIKGVVFLCVILRIILEDNRGLLLISVIISIVLLIQMKFLDDQQQQQLALLGQEQSAVLTINANDLTVNGDFVKAYAQVETKQQKFKTTIHYRLKSPKEKQAIMQQRQDYIWIAKVEFEPVDGQRNIKTFDYSKYLKSRRIFVATKVINIEKRYPQKGLISYLHQLRYQLVDKVTEKQQGSITSFSLALIFGKKDQMALEDLAMFKELGIMHLLAISGLHIMILVDILQTLLWRSGVTREASQWIVAIALIGYGCVIGWNISGTRAIVMVILQITCGKLFQKSLSTMDALAMVALVNCLMNPYIINSSAFLLSYGMCFFVLLVSRLQLGIVDEQGLQAIEQTSILEKLRAVIALCFLGLPLIAKYFYSYHLLSAVIGIVLTIFLAKWFIPVLLSYVIFVVVNIESVAYVVARIFNDTIQLMLWLLEQLSQWTIFKITLGAGSEVLWFGYYLVLTLFFLAMEMPRDTKRTIMTFITSVSVIGILVIMPYQFERKVIYLDVGQGDSSLIIDRGYNNVVLIDTGGQLSIPKEDWQLRKGTSHAERTVIPTLQALGISRIKTLIITHADTDHMGNVIELNQTFPIDRVVMSKGMEKNPKVKNMMKKCPNLTWQLIKAPVVCKQDEIMMQILSPLNESTGDNHDSLVADIKFCGVNWLFLGDIDQEKEVELIKNYPQLRTNILKIAHHGSNTSSHQQFLKAVNSQYAIISCGKHNLYRHPSQKVLNRLEEVGLEYARTDKEGAIELIPKKDRIIVHKVLTNERLIIIPK